MALQVVDWSSERHRQPASHTHTHTHTQSADRPSVRPRCNQCARHALGITIDLTGARTTDLPVRCNSRYMSLQTTTIVLNIEITIWKMLSAFVKQTVGFQSPASPLPPQCSVVNSPWSKTDCVSSDCSGFKSTSPHTVHLCLFPAALRFLWIISAIQRSSKNTGGDESRNCDNSRRTSL